MGINAILLDFVCFHCGKQCDAAKLDSIFYSAQHPCCSRSCKKAEDAKLAQPPDVVTVDDLDFELGGTA